MVKYALSIILEIIILKKKIASFLSLQDSNVKFPDKSLTFWQNFIFPWYNMEFPDNSITLKKFKIPWHFPIAYEPWHTKFYQNPSICSKDIEEIGIFYINKGP